MIWAARTRRDALLLEAHTDTLGGMVAQIKGNGRLRITNVGGMNNNAEAENKQRNHEVQRRY